MNKWLVGLVGVLGFSAQAHSATARVDLVYPTKCETGEAITACPVTGVRVFQRSSPTGPVVKTYDLPQGRLTMPLADLPPGMVCISALAISNGAEGKEAAVDPVNGCKVIAATKPGTVTVVITLVLPEGSSATLTSTPSP